MTIRRSTSLSLSFSLAALLLGGAAPLLVAQQSRPLFTWAGRVDREVQIAMRGRDVWARGASGNDGWRSRTQVRAGLPRNDGYVRAAVEGGRGEVSVIQQPNDRNDYTAILRIRDRSGGADRYRVSAYWEPSYSNGGHGKGRGNGRGNGGYGNGNGRGNVGGDHGHGNDGWGGAPGYPRSEGIDHRDRDADDDDRNGGASGRNGGYDDGGAYGGNAVRTALRWSGSVDSDAEIRIQGRRAEVRSLGGAGTRDVRSDVVSGLPQRDVQLMISRRQGRGNIVVVQQPSSFNGYTAILRVSDPQGGFGYYDFDLSWR